MSEFARGNNLVEDALDKSQRADNLQASSTGQEAAWNHDETEVIRSYCQDNPTRRPKFDDILDSVKSWPKCRFFA